MQELRVEGNFLMADFVDLSDEALELIKSKQFKNRSIELFNKFKNAAGKKIGKLVKGIALLGGSLPAVNLPDIKFHSIPETVLNFGQNQEVEVYEIEEGDMDNDVEIEALEKKEDDFMSEEATAVVEPEVISEVKEEAPEVAEVAEQPEAVEEAPQAEAKTEEMSEAIDQDYEAFKQFKEEFGDFSLASDFMSRLKKEKEEYEAKMAEFRQKEEEAFKKSQKNFIDTLLKEDKVIPAEVQSLEQILFSLDPEAIVELSDEFSVKKSVKTIDIFKTFLGNLPKRGNLGQTSSANYHGSWDSIFAAFLKEKGVEETAEELGAKEFAALVAECRKSSAHAEKLYQSSESEA